MPNKPTRNGDNRQHNNQNRVQGNRTSPAPRRTPAQRQAALKRKHRRRRRKMVRYAIVFVIIIIFIAIIISLATKSNKFSNFAENISPSNISIPALVESEVPLGPYDEAEMPMLLNAKNPLPENYEPTLVSVGYGNGRDQMMEERAGIAFNAMKEAAAAEGITLTPFSCYRSNQHQITNYNNSIQNYIAQGYSKEKAVEMTQQYFAVPGTSEHEAGFAVDINGIEESFENTKAFEWLQENCTEYGFILRYEKDTEPITGIAYEPWHYRYVGANHAKIIKEQGITLEEYVEQNTKATSLPSSASGASSNTVASAGTSKDNSPDMG